MLKNMNISNFGSFSNFDWGKSLREGGNLHEFKRLNIFYGRNYSGKTTLSRIFRSFELGKFPENHKQPEFQITLENKTVSQNDITSHSLDIRVFNRDYIDDNLSFLKDNLEGDVKTFAIIGSENKEIEKKIQQKEIQLGDVEQKSGLKFLIAQKAEALSKNSEVAVQASQTLETKLRRHANDVIKPNRAFGNPRYNITSIQQDIKTIIDDSVGILDESEIKQKNKLLGEETLPDIELKITFQPAFSALYEDAKETLTRKITPSAPIERLLNDALLQSWVREGMDYHRDKRSTCGFCGQSLPSDLWEKLDAHFNEESSKIEVELDRQIKAIQTEIQSVSSIALPEKDSFYTEERNLFNTAIKEFHETVDTYLMEIKKINEQLQNRQKDIFKSIKCPEVNDLSETLKKKINTLNEVINKNNAKNQKLPEMQEEAREKLRINAVAKFIRDIDLATEQNRITELESEGHKLKEEYKVLSNQAQDLKQEIEELRSKLQDEKKGAKKVNEYLNHFFGHEGLQLVAIEEPIESKYKFQIMRGNEPAYNMSEGECNLVSICYFIARLQDIGTKGKELIIYIDDPVSSLDNNHIFFVFSLIESELTKPIKNHDGSKHYRYKQIFISTHNLDFFKYLKRLSMPSKPDGGTDFFLVEKEGKTSNLRFMPKYLKDYQTEFHYLFQQIYRCQDTQKAHQNHEVFYNFGNNLRKFLEAFLFYKYPNANNKLIDKIHKFFGEDSTATALTNRISNELSHLEAIFDRSMRPIDIPEIPSVAKFVLDKMYEKDSEQFNSLLKSIGEPPREDD